MAFLFLSPRSGRAKVNVVSRSGDPMICKFFMPEEPWVVDLARKHALQHVLEEQRERKRLTGFSGDTCANKEFSRISQILCLVSASPGKLGHGILTDWTAEEEYLRKGLFEALEKSSSPCDELKLEAETLSALKCRVARAIERNEGKDFQAALSANPKKNHTEAAASQAAEATSLYSDGIAISARSAGGA